MEASVPLDLSAVLCGFVLVYPRELACASLLDSECTSAKLASDQWREDNAASKLAREKSEVESDIRREELV